MLRKEIFVTASIIFITSITALPVYAIDKPFVVPSNQGTTSAKALSGTPRQNLDATKIQSCQAHQAEIKNKLTNIQVFVTNRETVFDGIATKVETYYTTKVVPSGKTVPNYATLVAAIQTKKAPVQGAVTTLQTDVANFSCTSTDPKGTITKIRTDVQLIKTALKEYRTSIQELITAIHSVTGTYRKPTSPSHSDAKFVPAK